MERRPLLAVDVVPVELWYEGPTLLVARKPAGMRLYPEHAGARGTLINALLQANRWLAEMETSVAPGVIYPLRPQDAGLVLVAKTEGAASALKEAYRQARLRFRYRIRTDRPDPPPPAVTVFDHKPYGDTWLWDAESAVGDPAQLAEAWWGDGAAGEFFCYRLELAPDLAPERPEGLTVGLGDPVPLPDLELYTAPT
ncbi:MAG: hypothetical protein K6U14_00485 [Firmicutes bacterium]|nr:hypothetical protein [Alicyclobacillaceae bacterium]MCL6496098.1 hypothetical protein [Bacillota bacterium]